MPLIRSCSPLILVLVLALAPPVSAEPVAGAQTLDAEVPMEVVMRLLHIESPEQLTLGRLPDEVAQRLKLPADVQILAAVRRSASHHQVVGRTGRSEQELQPALIAALEQAGWSRPPPVSPAPRSGFVTSAEPCESLSFCGPDDAWLSASLGAADGGQTSLDLNLYTARDGSMCRERPYPRVWDGSGWADVLVPALEPPAGTRTFGQGGSSSGDHLSMSVNLETGSSPASLVDHYGGQLTAAGWRVGQTARTSRLAAADVEINSPEGDRVSGFLLVWCRKGSDQRCEAELDIARLPK